MKGAKTAGFTAVELFRPALRGWIPPPWLFVTCIFGVHAAIRFGGLWNPQLIPLSMAIIWPLPWLLSPRQARRRMGFKAPESRRWWLIGPLAALALLAVCAALAWAAFGRGNDNWFTAHSLALHEVLAQLPAGVSPAVKFWVATLPAMLFSPFAEEFLYRGFMLTGFSMKWGFRAALGMQATAFALVHLAHYGLDPFKPALAAVWLPSVFVSALVFGWIVRRSGSLWTAVVSHCVFNLGLNAVVFLWLPDLVGA